MKKMTMKTEEVIERLEILWAKLESEGLYTRANTCILAINKLRELKDEKTWEEEYEKEYQDSFDN